MMKLGRLYVQGDVVYMSDAGKGIHVINNTNPAAPEAVGFINIPGNTNMSIRGGFLYVDSFVDLAVLDIRDPANIFEVSRQTDVFPYDAFQAIDYEGYFLGADSTKGVVIGYEQ